MRIAVNTRFLIPDQLEGYGYFTQQVFMLMARQHPEHQFYFFFDRPWDSKLQFPPNVTPVKMGPKARHAISFRWWFDVKIYLALKKYKADVFVSPDGFCSLTTRVPQVLVIHDLAYLHFPKHISKIHRLFYKRYTPRFIKKAGRVATVSNFSKLDIIEKFGTPEQKIDVVYSAAKDIFLPIAWEEREQVKKEFAAGCEYFVFVGGIHPRKNLMNLFKAFSIFKKRQKTNMKLVIAGRFAWDFEETLKRLETFKFKDEVVLTGYLEEKKLAGLIAGAYALIYPSFFEGFGVPVLEAMQSGVAVITSNAGSLPEIGSDGALYADPADPADIADKMKTIYTNETLRSRLIEKGKTIAAGYHWQKTTNLLWQTIQQVVCK